VLDSSGREILGSEKALIVDELHQKKIFLAIGACLPTGLPAPWFAGEPGLAAFALPISLLLAKAFLPFSFSLLFFTLLLTLIY
jgi:hypothetical protein